MFNYVDMYLYGDILTRASLSPNVHCRGNKTRSWLLRILTFSIIWIYQFILYRLPVLLYNTQRHDFASQMNQNLTHSAIKSLVTFVIAYRQIPVYLWQITMQSPYNNVRVSMNNGNMTFTAIHTVYYIVIKHPPPLYFRGECERMRADQEMLYLITLLLSFLWEFN